MAHSPRLPLVLLVAVAVVAALTAPSVGGRHPAPPEHEPIAPEKKPPHPPAPKPPHVGKPRPPVPSPEHKPPHVGKPQGGLKPPAGAVAKLVTPSLHEPPRVHAPLAPEHRPPPMQKPPHMPPSMGKPPKTMPPATGKPPHKPPHP